MSTTPNPMSWRTRDNIASRPWRGKKREYDLFKEVTIGIVVISLLTIGLSALLGSPDDPSITLQKWANSAPTDFVTTATAELGGTSETAGYGPPYNSTPDATQTIGPLDLQSLSGVQIPIDTAKDIVLDPLAKLPNPPSEIATWKAASATDQSSWIDAYSKALADAPNGDYTQVAAGDYGPVPAITGALLASAQSGALDGVLQSKGDFYTFDYTPTILFLGDGSYFQDIATAQHLTGDQWGMMNETGNTPGQSWLWLFSFFYQVEPTKSAPNADILVVGIMLILSMLLVFVPFLPVIRSFPRWIPVHKLVWRDYYKKR